MTVAASPAQTKLEIGQVVPQTFALTWRAAPILVPLAILNEVVGRGVSWLVTRNDPFVLMAMGEKRHLPSPLDSLLSMPEQILRGLVYAAMTWVAYTVYRGGRATPENLLTAWSRALIPLLLLQLVFGVMGATAAPLNWWLLPGNAPLVMALAAIGILIWVIAYGALALALWLAVDVAIIEGCDALAAIRRSVTLTRGNRWRILWISLLVAIAAIVAMFALWGSSGVGIPPRAPIGLWTPVGAASFILQMSVGAFLSASSAIIYSQRSDPAPQAEAFS